MAFDATDPSDDGYMSMSLHDMFRIIGDQMTSRDLKVLKYISSAFISAEMLSNITNGYDFFLCLETMNRVTETNFRHVLDLLQIISRQDLSHLVNLRRRHPVLPDPVCEYLEMGTSGSSRSTNNTAVSDGLKNSRTKNLHICGTSSDLQASSSNTDLTTSSDAVDKPGPSSSVVDFTSNQITVVEKSGPSTRTRSKSKMNKSYFPSYKRKHTSDVDVSVQLQENDKPPKKMQRVSTSSSRLSKEPCCSHDLDTSDESTNSCEQRECDRALNEQETQDEMFSGGNNNMTEPAEGVGSNTQNQTLSKSSSSAKGCEESSAMGGNSNRLSPGPDRNDKKNFDTASCDNPVDCCDNKREADKVVTNLTDKNKPSENIPIIDCSDSLPGGSKDSNSSTCCDKQDLSENTEKPNVFIETSSGDKETNSSETSFSSPNCKSASSSNSTNVQHGNSEVGSRVRYVDPTSESRSSCIDSASGSTSSNRRSDSVAGSSRTQHDDSSRTTEESRVKCNESSEANTNEKLHSKIRKQRYTCDIRLRVRAEYCQHSNALEGNVFSNKPTILERQFEKFTQANTILKSRDLGAIVCDIKFSELTYLDAFWRDYINGSLLEALKGIFLTDSLKQAVGHEAIKLLVNVDEDDYESGRLKLLKNLTD